MDRPYCTDRNAEVPVTPNDSLARGTPNGGIQRLKPKPKREGTTSKAPRCANVTKLAAERAAAQDHREIDRTPRPAAIRSAFFILYCCPKPRIQFV